MESSTRRTEMLEQAIMLYDDGDRKQAKYVLEAAYMLDRKDERVLLWRAGLSDSREEALGYLETILGINPDNQVAKRWAQRFSEATVSNSLTALGSTVTADVAPEPIEESEEARAAVEAFVDAATAG